MEVTVRKYIIDANGGQPVMNKSSALTGSALGWIREDLDKQLRKVRLQVEHLSGNSLAGNDALLATAEELEQLRLTFRTLVLDGVAQVMGEMHALCARMQEESPPDREATMAALMEAMVVIPAYLDRLQAGHRDLPVLLMPLVNRLREVRGVEPLSEGTLFTPLLDVELPELDYVRRPGYDEPFDYFARRMRRQYEMALLDWQHDQSDLSLLSPLQGICETMRHRLERYDLKRLWWVATELVGGLMDGVAENDLNLRRLLARLHLLLQNIYEGGEDAVSLDTTTSITQALLFHVAKARKGHPGLDLVRERFELERLIPDREALLRAHGTLSGRDREMYTSLSKAVQDELSLIKDALDLELRTGEIEPDRRRQSLEALTRLCDTLRMLGLSSTADAIAEAIPGFEASNEASRSERERRLMSMAEHLLAVESALDEQIDTLGEGLPEDYDETATSWEMRRTRSHLLDEAVASVYLSQDAVRKRLGGDADANPFGPLEDVAGALQMIGESAVAAQARQFTELLRKRLKHIFSEAGIRARELTAITDAMAALELYLAARRDQQRDADRFLHILDDRIGVMRSVQPMEAEVRPFPTPTPLREPETPQPAETGADAAAEPGPPPEESPVIEVAAEAMAEPAPAPEPAVAPADADLPQPIDPELRDIFLEEYESVLESLHIAIPDWMNNASNVDALTRIRRAFHTLKGSGRMVGADELGDFSWQVEDMLNALLEGRTSDATDIQVMVRLAQATLPALRQRLLQQQGGMGKALIHRIGELAQAIGRGQRADWESLRHQLPPYLASMLPGAIRPSTGMPGDDEENILAIELQQNLRPVQELLEAISRDRATRVDADHVRAVHTITGALAMEPEGRDAEVARALERVLEAQSRTGHRFSNESVWTLVSAVGQIQARLDRLQGSGEPTDPEEQAELIGQLMVLTREFETVGDEAPATGSRPPTAFDPGRSVFAQGAGAADQAPHRADADDAGLDEEMRELEAETARMEAAVEAADLAEDRAADADITGIFLDEAGEVLGRADTLLHQWRDDVPELRFVRHLQREIHTFKGGARMAGLLGVGDYSHSVESLLERIAEGTLDPSVEAIALLEDACDRLHRWVEQVAAGQQPASAAALEKFELQVVALLAPVAEPAADEAEAVQPAAEREVHELEDAPEAQAERADDNGGPAQIRVDAELLDKLVNAAGEVSIFRSRLEQQVGGLRSNLSEFDETISRMREQFRKLEIEIETQIRSNYTPTSGNGDTGFDPLEMDEFSTLHQLSRGLSESVADLMNLQDMLADNARKSEQLLVQQSRVASELQEGLMRTRMVPFGSIAPRLRRIVRGAASESGKKARLQMRVIGSSDELDRNVLEHITVPLEHMMRNAVVHGVETPKQRKAAGKPVEGDISVTVESEATEFVIRIEDDGAGINLDAIRELAVERGLLDAGAEPRPEQLHEFILDSGFSTSDSVTRLAGRGVGMDVVSSEIKQIGGSLEIDSEAGRGTRFTVRIPFTLAVMQAIGVIAGKQRYLLPLSSVVGVSRMAPDEYTALVAGDNPQFKFAGEDYPVLDMEGVLGEPAHPLERDNVSLLILNAGEQRAAFRVVELLPHREIVIKPVGPQVSCVPGILGGSISANGEVLIILDPGPLIRHARLHGVRPAPLAQPVVEEKQHPVAMVVDDSITMRKVTSRVLEGHGMEVVTARDGIEALELMQDRVPDILLLDIEMPRMDGYELAQNVRDDVRLRHIPIIMITSRAGQKHRDRAAQVGANAYLSKPYAESELVDEVDRLLEEGID